MALCDLPTTSSSGLAEALRLSPPLLFPVPLFLGTDPYAKIGNLLPLLEEGEEEKEKDFNHQDLLPLGKWKNSDEFHKDTLMKKGIVEASKKINSSKIEMPVKPTKLMQNLMSKDQPSIGHPFSVWK